MRTAPLLTLTRAAWQAAPPPTDRPPVDPVPIAIETNRLEPASTPRPGRVQQDGPTRAMERVARFACTGASARFGGTDMPFRQAEE
ncbi:hypothetical protein [Jannaschia seohaensis]|uniref:hypothetical protein n=1 Tax=Jannaschia seohaensis TaxID=475081 RepID=UPI000D6AD1FC|nr:hypothetical protein [Jannaschia seohaensis]